jgi:hypothetical protein
VFDLKGHLLGKTILHGNSGTMKIGTIISKREAEGVTSGIIVIKLSDNGTTLTNKAIY